MTSGADMATAKRPGPWAMGSVRVRAIRGPREKGVWYWRAELYEDGGSVTVWSGWGTRKAAEGEIITALASGSFRKPKAARPVVLTVRDLLERWVEGQEVRPDLSIDTIRLRISSARRLLGVLEDVRLDQVTQVVMEEYRDQRLRRYASRTVLLDMQCMLHAWRWGRARGYCEGDFPAAPVRVVDEKVRYTPTSGEVAAIIERLPAGWPLLAVRLLYATGMRLGELASLTVAKVDLDRELLNVTGKTGAREVPVSAEVVELLRRWLADHPELGSNDPLLGLKYSAVGLLNTRHLPVACAEAGVPRFTTHAFRRSAVDMLARSGVDVGTAAAILGHSPVVMLQVYRKVTPDDRREAVAKAGLGRLPKGRMLRLHGTDDER